MSHNITPAQRRAVGRYESANYDKVLIRLPKGDREKIKSAADAAGESLNAYIVGAIRDRMGGGKSTQKPEI